MFLRSHQRIKDGKPHEYFSLVETVRTPSGPRQRTLCYLGELNGSAQSRWLKTIAVFNEQGESRQLKLFPSEVAPPEDDAQMAQVLIDRVRLERTRAFGECFLGLELWRRLELDGFFASVLDRAEDEAEVRWSQVAALLAINRLCAPGSELAVEQRWFPSTALDDLLGIDGEKINDTRLYRCLDRLLPHKAALEQHLKQRYGELFAAQFDVLLYDLTSSYVEGAAAKNPMMQRGYSRDHRPDCKQLVIALIVNPEGFPLSYEIFDGNRADVTTLEAMVRLVERKYGRARRVWVFDRGIVSEENLALLRRRGGQYLVGTPRSKLREFRARTARRRLATGARRCGGEAGTGAGRRGNLYPVPLHRRARKKNRPFAAAFPRAWRRRSRRWRKRVAAGQLRDRNKIERQLGAIQARHPQVADLYDVALRDTAEGVRLSGRGKEERRSWRRCAKAPICCAPIFGRDCRTAVDEVHPTDRSRGRFPGTEERALHAPHLPSTRAARQGPRDGGVSRLCAVGHAQTPAEASAGDCSDAIGERSRQRSTTLANEGTRSALHAAKRRHCSSHNRWPRDPSAPHY